jgi:methyltransferase (TIGR00027 family)
VLTDGPSQTALTAAAARAAHLIVDGEPRLFHDPLAETLLGDRAEELIAYHRSHGEHPILAGARAQVTIRARYTEARATGAGHDQYVILGAGLDSFAHRRTVHMRVFEVDHPASQRWKRGRLRDAGLAEPAHVRYVPVDFEREELTPALVAAGLDLTRPAVVSWLGVSMYLTRSALDATLHALSALAAGTEVIFDYFVPEPLRDENGRLYAELVSQAMVEWGEPWRTVLTPDEARDLLAAHGFGTVAMVSQQDVPELRHRGDALRPSTLSMLAHGRRLTG